MTILVQITIFAQSFDPAWSIALDHESLVIDVRVFVGLLSRNQDINDLEDSVADSNDRTFVSPTDHKSLIKPLELAVGLSGGISRLAQNRADIPVALAASTAFSLAGALVVPRAHSSPRTKTLPASKPAHVHPDFVTPG